jgi:hypothetical protein
MRAARISALELVGIIIMVAAVCVLGMLQYRSIHTIGEEEQTRLKVSLAAGVRGFDQDFAYDVERLCEGFELDPESGDATTEQRIARLYETWRKNAAEPELIQDVELWKTDGNETLLVESIAPNSHVLRESASDAKTDGVDEFLDGQLKTIPPMIAWLPLYTAFLPLATAR